MKLAWWLTSDLNSERSIMRLKSVRAPVSARDLRRLQATLAALPQEPRSVLDCGGGVGHLATALRHSHPGATIFLADLSHVRLRQSDEPRRVVADSVHLPFRTGAFELVVSAEMLEHIHDFQVDSALQELKRVALRDLVITVPNNEDLSRAQLRCNSCRALYHPHGHQRSYTRRKLSELSKGTQLLNVEAVGGWEFRLPSTLVHILRKRGLMSAPSVGESCPDCGSSDARLDPGGFSMRRLFPSARRPWLLLHCRIPAPVGDRAVALRVAGPPHRDSSNCAT